MQGEYSSCPETGHRICFDPVFVELSSKTPEISNYKNDEKKILLPNLELIMVFIDFRIQLRNVSILYATFFFFLNFWRTLVLFVGPLIPLFRTSGDVSSGFQSQSGFCLIRA